MLSAHRMKNRFLSLLTTRVPAVARRFVARYHPLESEGIPWTPLAKPLPECLVALVTTAGVQHADQPHFDMEDHDGDPSYRVLDLEDPSRPLTIVHDYYDHTDADRDLNIVLPVDRLRESAAEGLIGGLARRAYGFMGHITGRHVAVLVEKTAPEVARLLREDRADVVLLTPG